MDIEFFRGLDLYPAPFLVKSGNTLAWISEGNTVGYAIVIKY
jgi:hypothetical protein